MLGLLGEACARPSLCLAAGSTHRSRVIGKRQLMVKCSTNGSLHSLQRITPAQGFPARMLHKVGGVLDFLKEQFNEFQKIEWPSLDTTVRTSLFVIVLSFFLVVALTAIDSGFTILLSKML